MLPTCVNTNDHMKNESLLLELHPATDFTSERMLAVCVNIDDHTKNEYVLREIHSATEFTSA